MKRFWPFVLIMFGIMTIILGLMYDVLFAGIPYQDPTPAMIANYNFHSQIASIIRWVGAGICLLGGAAVIIRSMMNKRQDQRT
jgi:hypothetical protein